MWKMPNPPQYQLNTSATPEETMLWVWVQVQVKYRKQLGSSLLQPLTFIIILSPFLRCFLSLWQWPPYIKKHFFNWAYSQDSYTHSVTFYGAVSSGLSRETFKNIRAVKLFTFQSEFWKCIFFQEEAAISNLINHILMMSLTHFSGKLIFLHFVYKSKLQCGIGSKSLHHHAYF